MKPVTSVPLLDLQAQYAAIKPEVDAAVANVIESQQFINGPDVAALESEIAAYCGAAHCIGVSSGTDALLIALMALDIGPGDEVITSPYSFFATAGSIVRAGAKPVFVDIDPDTFNIDVTQIAAKITPRTKAIMPVHLFGQCADMEPLQALAAERKLPIIEDAAQAIGAEDRGMRAGTLGTIGCFSFFPSKNLGAFGDGGAVTTNDPQLAEKLFMLRNHGMKPKYYHKIVGGNFRIDTIQAAVLRVKLRSLDMWTMLRRKHASFYTSQLISLVETPKVVQNRHIFNQYCIRTSDRDALREYLTQARIGNEVYYPVPLHLQECFADLGHKPGDFPHSERAANTSIALPVYPELSEAQKAYVCENIAAFMANKRSRTRAA